MVAQTPHTTKSHVFQTSRKEGILTSCLLSLFSPFPPSALPSSFFSRPLFSTTQPHLHAPESLFRAADGRGTTCFFLRVHSKLGHGITAPPQTSRLLGPGSWCSAPLPHTCVIAIQLTRNLGRRENGGWDRGGTREPEGGETADIRSIQKWKEGGLGGRRRILAEEK